MAARLPLSPRSTDVGACLGVGTRGEGFLTRRSALDSDKWGRWRPLVLSLGAPMAVLGSERWGWVGGTSMQGKTIADRAGATLWVGWVVWWTCQAPSVAVRQAMAGLAIETIGSE